MGVFELKCHGAVDFTHPARAEALIQSEVIMYKTFGSILMAALLTAPVTNASTKLTTTWRDPNVGKVNFSKIVVTFLSKDDDLRSRVEGGLARRIPRSVAANTIVSNEDLKDRETIKAHLQKNGVDGAIVVRLVDFKKDWVVSEGQTWYASLPSYWDSWDANWLPVHTASYAYQEKVVTADIILYSVATAKPVWTGRLKSTNPKFLKNLLDDLVKEGAEELKKQGLI
jgi:hypothetical protein